MAKLNSYVNCRKFHLIGFILLVFCYLIEIVKAGSCKEASLCCNGRDSSCVVQQAPINAIIEDLNDKPCYCDHACLKLGDCCTDFKQHCGVNDCVVSEFTEWSDCDAVCGTGMMSRTRTIIKIPQNGGKHCPSLVQKRGCQGFKCPHNHDRRIIRESALLLPAKFSKNRRANDTSDIRRNLRLRYTDSLKHKREQEYCIEFEVIKATKSCHKIAPYNLLAEGDRVSVRCDYEALVKDTTATTSTSSGSSTNEILSNSSIQDDIDIEIPITKKQKFRCRGEGLPGRNTRWSALAVPSCRGKWLRLTVGEPKNCTDSQFIFI